VSAPPPCPPKAEEWFTHALTEMTQRNLGGHFNAALAAWTRLESACKFASPSHKLSATGRPKQVSQWIQGARGHRGQPAPIVTKPREYKGIWWGWWDSLQPEWRKKGEDGTWEVGESYGEWDDALLHWGPNGLLSVIASLYFWGCAVVDSPDLAKRWERAVNDVSWVLE
ncbi:hypothetical protein DFH07DRAFT_715076, partial [Mycena maculata]